VSRLGKILVTLLATTPLLVGGLAHAYDAENTHRWIAREAAELLVATYPGEYDEVIEYTSDIIEGAFHEDDFFLDGDNDPETLRVMRHFFYAPTGRGLIFHGIEFPSSYEWNAIENDQNEWDYFDGLHAYQRGDLAQAYFIAAHTMHLIADLTVPAHSHADAHGPPYGDTYENHCSSRTYSTYESSLFTVPVGTPIPEFLDLKDAFQKTADASYYRNLYPGNLDGDVPTGVIAQMFPDMSKGFFSGVWQIDGVGKIGKDFYEEQPGFYYFKKNNVVSHADITSYDPMRPSERVYGEISSDIPMVERMANEMVPLAILHSAAVLKMFIDEARSLPKTTNPSEIAPADGGGCNASSSQPASMLFVLLFLISMSQIRQTRNNLGTK